MRVLLIAPLNLPWHTSRYVTESFARCGWDVMGFDYRNPFRTKDAINEELLGCRDEHFDLILILKGELIKPEVLKEFKAPKALWYFDIPIIPELIELGKVCDFFFLHVKHEEIKQMYRDRGIEITHLPQGVSLMAHYPADFDKDFQAVISFLGSYDLYREGMLEELSKEYSGIKIWGNGWKGTSLQKLWQEKPAYHSDYRKVCSSAKMILNLGRQGIWKWDISARIFMTAACMGFQVSHYVEELSEYFEPGKEIAVFDENRPLSQTIRHYLKHTAERKRIVEAAYQRVMTSHTYDHRIRGLLKWMKL